MDNYAFGRDEILLARPCEKTEHEAEAIGVKGLSEARYRDSPRLVFSWSTWKTEHHLGDSPGIEQEWSGGDGKTYERIVSGAT